MYTSTQSSLSQAEREGETDEFIFISLAEEEDGDTRLVVAVDELVE